MTRTGHEAAADPAWEVRRRYFPAVEGMRAVAVLCVMCGHVLLTAYPTGNRHDFAGWLAPFGVVIFFGISGFLLYRTFLAARFAHESVGRVTPGYIWRRAVRIIPAYWVALTLGSLWVGWEGTFSGHWWVYYGLLQTYNPSWLAFGLPIAWSLCIEATFYLFLPLFALVLLKRGLGSGRPDALRWELGALLGLALIGLAWRMAMGSIDTNLNANLLGTIVWFASGMALAAIEVAHPASLAGVRRALASPRLCWPIAAALFIALYIGVSEIGGTPVPIQSMIQTLFYGAAAILLLSPAALGESNGVVRVILENRWIVFIGMVSYGIYLWHYTVLAEFDSSHLTVDSGHYLISLAALVIGVSLALGAASWYLVEKPLMRRAHSVKAFRHVKRGAVEVAEDDDPPPSERPAPLPAPAPDVSG